MRRAADRKTQPELLAEYTTFPLDQPVSEGHAAARLLKSRSWLQWKRSTGGGPRFQRTPTGKIFYVKRDVEEFLAGQLIPFSSTSEYRSERAAA